MPTVISYDSPALVAALAGGAGQFATNESEQLQAMRSQQMALAQFQAQQQADAQRAHIDAQQQQLAMQRQAFNARLAGAQQQPAEQRYQQQLAQTQQINQRNTPEYALAMQQAQPQPPQQQPGISPDAMGIIDQLEQAGKISPTEAARRRGLAMTGGNPFTQPFSDPGAPSSQDRLRANDEYRRRRQGIMDQINILNQRLRNTHRREEREQIESQLDQLQSQLADLAGDDPNHQQQASTDTTVSVMTAEEAVRKYGTAARAREAHQRGEFQLQE